MIAFAGFGSNCPTATDALIVLGKAFVAVLLVIPLALPAQDLEMVTAPQASRGKSGPAPTWTDICRNHVGLAVLLIRTPSAEALAAWYSGVLRLPIIRGREPTFFLWVGETLVLELLSDNSDLPAARPDDPDTAPVLLIFRVHDLTALLQRLQARGVEVVSRRSLSHGAEAFIRDPEGNLLGLRTVGRDSPYASDRAAWRRFDAGDPFNPGAAMLPPDVQGLGWIRRNAVDARAAARFYERAVGLERVDEEGPLAHFQLGNGVVLEVAGGGHKVPVPASRTQVPVTFVIRVEDHMLMNRWLKLKELRIVDDALKFNSAELTYFADLDGQVVGIDERYEPHEYTTRRRPFAEDLETERRWLERRDQPRCLTAP